MSFTYTSFLQSTDKNIPKVLNFGDIDLLYTVKILESLLAVEYVFYSKLQNFHWNLTGISFIEIHKLLGEHYEKVGEFIDALAEQIRKYGRTAPGSLQEFLIINERVNGIKQMSGNIFRQNLVINEMMKDNEIIIRMINDLDNNSIDLATQNMLGNILDFHMKAAWIWRSQLE